MLRLPVIILHLHHGLRGVHHAPIDHGVDLQRDVIAGDDVLRGDFESLLAQIDADHLLHGRKDKDEAGTFGILLQAAKGEDYAALILAQNLDAIDEIQENDDECSDNRVAHGASIWFEWECERILWYPDDKSKIIL